MSGPILAKDYVLWKCDHCGGPAVWTMFRGVPFYHCESQCEEFSQMELFEEHGVERITRGEDAQDAGRLLPENDQLEELPF